MPRTIPADEDYGADPSTNNEAFKVGSNSGAKFEQLIIDTSTISTSTIDTIDVTILTLSATVSVDEIGGSNVLTYTATLTQAPSDTLTVNLDYTNDGNVDDSIQVTGGVTVTVTRSLVNDEDHLVETESVQAVIVSVSNDNFESLTISTTPAVTNILDTITKSFVSLEESASPSPDFLLHCFIVNRRHIALFCSLLARSGTTLLSLCVNILMTFSSIRIVLRKILIE